MRLSAGRIRSLATRYALAEAAAFPGISTEQNSFARRRGPGDPGVLSLYVMPGCAVNLFGNGHGTRPPPAL